MLGALDQIERDGLSTLGAAASEAALEAWRIEYLGAKGRVKGAMAGLKDVPKEERPAFGQRLNELKVKLEGEYESRRATVGATGPGGSGGAGGRAAGPDLTEPGLIETREVG